MEKDKDILPIDLEQAVLLQDAFFGFSDPESVEKYNAAKEKRKNYEAAVDPEYMRRMGRVFIYDSRFKKEEQKQLHFIKSEFVQNLNDGTFTAWAREGSPLAPMTKIPASAWTLLKLKNVPQSIIKGPHSDLYDVHIIDNRTHDVAPRVKKKSGRPSKMDIVIKEYKRRASDGIGEDSQRGEALYLESWFKENHPDLSSPHHRTIENNISKIVKESSKENK